MDLYTTLFEVIDMRSFSNLWYWIGLAVLWSSASYRVLGVPFDMIQKAQKLGGDAVQDLNVISHLHASRITTINSVAGLWTIGSTSFVLTALALLATVYRMEFAQAVLLMAAPMVCVAGFALSTATKIQHGNLKNDALIKILLRQRFVTQLVGVLAIFVTAMWGMYQNLSLGVL